MKYDTETIERLAQRIGSYPPVPEYPTYLAREIIALQDEINHRKEIIALEVSIAELLEKVNFAKIKLLEDQINKRKPHAELYRNY